MRHLAVISALVIMVIVCDAPNVFSAPIISNVVSPTSEVGRYNIFTVFFDVVTMASNPYWPYDANTPSSIKPGIGITVEAILSNDNWATSIVAPAFYYQAYSRHRIDSDPIENTNCELYTPTDSPHWAVRFSPQSTGLWRYRLRATDATGVTTTSSEWTFSCVESSSHGFVGIGPNDSGYFELSDGTPLIGPGINGHLRSSYYADKILKLCGDNAVRTVRFWMNAKEFNPVFAGIGQNWAFASGASLAFAPDSRDGQLFCVGINPGGYCYQNIFVTAGTRYRVVGFVRTSGLSGGGLKIWIGSAGDWTRTRDTASGTSPWTKISFEYTATTTGRLALWFRNNATAGIAYFDDFSVESSVDGGTTWLNGYLSKADFDTQNYMDQIESAEVDNIFDAAKINGVYLKTVVTEKWDDILSRINSTGEVTTPDISNSYASADHPSRWLQKAWWRYMTARWGAYTSLHSWEWCNEGDPNNGNHWNAAAAMADYVHSNYPRRILCTTSFYQGPVQAEFWKWQSIDYIDSHDYICTNLPGQGYYTRIYAPFDLVQGTPYNEIALPWSSSQGAVDYDDATKHSGRRSLRGTTTLGRGPSSWLMVAPRYHIGIDPTHTYTLRYWIKGQNIAPDPDVQWWKGGFTVSWSKSFHENDFVPDDVNVMPTTTGTYDWIQVTESRIVPPASANTANIYFRCPSNPTQSAIVWLDDVEFIDETTGQNLMVGGGYEDDRMDYDIALAVNKFGTFYKSYSDRFEKPTICGETGISTWNRYGTPYKGYQYTDENQELVDDIEGIHFRKFVWAHAGPYNPTMLYWWTELLENGNSGEGYWKYFAAFSKFMKGIPVSSGQFRDVASVVSNSSVRVLGQKDPINNMAYLWIDNMPYTWKAVADHNFSPLPWNSTTKYYLTSICLSSDGNTVYQSRQDDNVSHPLTDSAWWQPLGIRASNPPLPPAISGTIVIPGLRDGIYRVEWWNTTTGTIDRTQDISCANGNIVLSVNNLQSDIACKIYPAPAKVDLKILVPTNDVVPGQVVTVTVQYTNAGESDAHDITVSARIPAEMDYVAGSAESTGGTYDPVKKMVQWLIADAPAHEVGTRTFEARVR